MAENSINNNEENKMTSEKLRINLRKMIKSFDNFIKDANDYDQLEDNLKHMEETDENFHKYDLVEMITDRIEATLGSSIDRHVNEAFNTTKFDGDIDLQNKMAQSICASIMRTKEFADFKVNFKANVFKANESLMKNFQSNFIESNSEEVTIHENETKSLTFTNDFEYSSSLDNSLNQNSFVFFNSEQFPLIAQNLDPRKPETARLRAIQQLLSIPAGDPQAADHWVDIRKYLLSAFKDPNEKIAELCLKLHSRTLASSHYKVSLEIYITLLEHLSEYFKERELEKRSIKASTDFLSHENSYLLKIFRLINDYAKDITNKWTRYPESFIETIINETLKLFSIIGSDQKFGIYMTPVHFISLLDIQSNWFVKWMHGHDSRRILINAIKKNESFLQNSIISIQQYLNYSLKRLSESSSSISSLNSTSVSSAAGARKKSTTNSSVTTTTTSTSTFTTPSGIVASKRTIFRKSEIEYAHFVHSINVIRKILCFKNGRRLLPIKVANKDVTLKDLIKTIIQIIYETASFKTTNEYSPAKYAFDLLQDLCAAEETCEVCFCNEEVIEHLIKPLKAILQLKKNQNQVSISSLSSNINNTNGLASNNFLYDESCMLIIANVLSKLASTECGYSQLIFNDSKQNFSPVLNKSSAANIIIIFVCKALSNQLNYNVSSAQIAEYLYLARLLYSQCQGAFLIKEYELNKAISDVLKVIINKESLNSNSAPNTPRVTSSNITYKETFSFSWSDSLLDNLVSMASTPKGVFYLTETGLLGRVVNYMFCRYKSKLQVGKFEKFGYGFIISQLANTPSGCFYLNESLLIQHLIDEIWTELEYGSDDFMSAFPRSYSVEPIDREVYKPMLCLLNILSSFSAVYELLADVTATPRSFYDIRDGPKGLIGLLDRVTFLDKKIKMTSLCNYEQSHIFGLKLLSFLQTDLDVLLLLESQYTYSSLLLSLQKANRPLKAKYDFYDETGNINQEEDHNESLDSDESAEKLNIMIDMLSVERNFVLVNSNLIGGPNEKLIPSRDFIIEQQHNDKSFSAEKNKTYAYPLFDEMPVPDFYLKYCDYSLILSDQNFTEFIKTKFEFEQIIKNEDSQTKWLSKFRKLFYNQLKGCKLSLDIMHTALNQIMQVYLRGPEFNNLIGIGNEYKNCNEFLTKSSSQILGCQINNLQKLGIEKTIKYGQHIGQLQSNKEENIANLLEIYKASNVLLKNANKNKKISASSSSNIKRSYLNCCQEESLPSYDWFIATIFLLFKGEKQSVLNFLYNLQSLKMSTLLWPARLYSNESLISNTYALHGINIHISTTCHYIELILKVELPIVFSAFRMSGLAPSQICSHWLKQLFWNYLDWPNIVTFISVCIIYGIDYQTYFCVALLKHLNKDQKIVQHHTYKDLQIYLKENQIEDFNIEKYIDFMFELENKYRYLIMEDIKNLFG